MLRFNIETRCKSMLFRFSAFPAVSGPLIGATAFLHDPILFGNPAQAGR